MLERARQGAKDMIGLTALIPAYLFIMPLILRVRLSKEVDVESFTSLQEGSFKEAKIEKRNSWKQIFLPNGTSAFAVINGVGVLLRDFKVRDDHSGGAIVQFGGNLVKNEDTHTHDMKGGKSVILSHNGQSEYIEELDVTAMYANIRLLGNTPNH